jgi:MoaA/NifB/PqqE/SkfB family radical SAM enzyme
MTRWTILYRGPLSSCNYACDYCPFAKTRNTREELADDARRLGRFVQWVADREEQIGVLFTPWGEALIRRHYQEAFVELGHLPNVWRVAAQTNLSCRLDWLDRCDLETVALWTTFHPTQTTAEKFLRKCRRLDALGARYSVGVVGFKDAWVDIVRLRDALPDDVYLWINAYKRDPDYYTERDIRRFESIDPLFRINTRYHHSLGESCRGGATSFTVDGEGDVRRCHFIEEPIGNLWDQTFDDALAERPCTNERCGCHIGYVHMDRMGLYDVFGEGVLERIPSVLPTPTSGRG